MRCDARGASGGSPRDEGGVDEGRIHRSGLTFPCAQPHRGSRDSPCDPSPPTNPARQPRPAATHFFIPPSPRRSGSGGGSSGGGGERALLGRPFAPRELRSPSRAGARLLRDDRCAGEDCAQRLIPRGAAGGREIPLAGSRFYFPSEMENLRTGVVVGDETRMGESAQSRAINPKPQKRCPHKNTEGNQRLFVQYLIRLPGNPSNFSQIRQKVEQFVTTDGQGESKSCQILAVRLTKNSAKFGWVHNLGTLPIWRPFDVRGGTDLGQRVTNLRA